MWNIQANIYLDEEAKQKDPVIGDLLERVMNKYVCVNKHLYRVCIYVRAYVHNTNVFYYICSLVLLYVHVYILTYILYTYLTKHGHMSITLCTLCVIFLPLCVCIYCTYLGTYVYLKLSS